MFGWIIYRLNSLVLPAGQFCGKELILERRKDCWTQNGSFANGSGIMGWENMGTERAAIRAADFQTGCGHWKQGAGWVFLVG